MGADEVGATEGVEVGAEVGASEVTFEVGIGVRTSGVLVVVVLSGSAKALPRQSSFETKLNFVAQQVSGSGKTSASRSGGPEAQTGLPIS